MGPLDCCSAMLHSARVVARSQFSFIVTSRLGNCLKFHLLLRELSRACVDDGKQSLVAESKEISRRIRLNVGKSRRSSPKVRLEKSREDIPE